jgi:predicted nucleic acid-binding protein
MSDRVFLDTNILVYTIEQGGSNQEKSSVALELARRDDICISTQVLGEFYNAVTSSRRKSALTHDEATAWIQLWKRYDVRDITTKHVDLALEIADRLRLSYYDSLILSAARDAGCQVLYSEDMSDSQDYEGVTVTNPFA